MQLKYSLLILFIISMRVQASNNEDDELTDEDYYDENMYSSTLSASSSSLSPPPSSSSSSSSSSAESDSQSLASTRPHTSLIDDSITTTTTPYSLFAPFESLASKASNLTSSFFSNIVTKETATTTTTETIETESSTDTITSACPDVCQCNELRIVNCSNHNLTEIPSNLPNNAIRIDLSHNQLKQLNISQLEHCADLRELLLHKNQIETIVDKHKFSKLHRLDHINLSWNSIKTLHGDEFSNAKKLTKLSLSHNAIEITDDIPILNITNLLILDLVDCNLTAFGDNIFETLHTLTSLDLKENPLEPKINANAFKPLVNLVSLRMPSVNHSQIYELCKALKSIDDINTTEYDISCFNLVNGESFEDSTITASPPTTHLTHIERTHLAPHVITTAKNRPHIQIPTSTVQTRNDDETPKVLQSGKQANETVNEGEVITPTNKTDSESSTTKSLISADTVKYLLIGIVIASVLGLIIGIICRKDWCGIKTKMCRKNRRPVSTDQVRPAEEVPLNKV